MTTALEQQREDAALGAAWRRCEAALPVGGSLGLTGPWLSGRYSAISSLVMEPRTATTPTEALTALAEALEARREAAG